MKKWILLAIVLLVAVGGWYVYKLFSEKTPDVVNKTPDIITDVTKLIAAFDKDTASASKQYIDKIVEITGNVKRIDTSGSIVMGDEGDPSEVVIGLDRRHMKDYEKLKVGATAVIQGVCSGYEKAGGDDLLASLGTTVELRSAGLKEKK